MRVFVETVVGLLVFAGMLVAPACISAVRHPHLGEVISCAGAAPAMLCDRVTVDGKYECAICRDSARGCLTGTSIWCASSCDSSLCESRR